MQPIFAVSNTEDTPTNRPAAEINNENKLKNAAVSGEKFKSLLTAISMTEQQRLARARADARARYKTDTPSQTQIDAIAEETKPSALEQQQQLAFGLMGTGDPRLMDVGSGALLTDYYKAAVDAEDVGGDTGKTAAMVAIEEKQEGAAYMSSRVPEIQQFMLNKYLDANGGNPPTGAALVQFKRDVESAIAADFRASSNFEVRSRGQEISKTLREDAVHSRVSAAMDRVISSGQFPLKERGSAVYSSPAFRDAMLRELEGDAAGVQLYDKTWQPSTGEERVNAKRNDAQNKLRTAIAEGRPQEEIAALRKDVDYYANGGKNSLAEQQADVKRLADSGTYLDMLSKADTRASTMDSAIEAAATAEGIVLENPITTTGLLGFLSSMVPSTEGFDLDGYIEVVKSASFLKGIGEIKGMSEQGGGIGALAVPEMVAIQSTIANMKSGDSREKKIADLKKISRHFNNARLNMYGETAQAANDEIARMQDAQARFKADGAGAQAAEAGRIIERLREQGNTAKQKLYDSIYRADRSMYKPSGADFGYDKGVMLTNPLSSETAELLATKGLTSESAAMVKVLKRDGSGYDTYVVTREEGEAGMQSIIDSLDYDPATVRSMQKTTRWSNL